MTFLIKIFVRFTIFLMVAFSCLKGTYGGIGTEEHDEHWCYGHEHTETEGEHEAGSCGPETWPGVCNTGKHQSPINIVNKDVIGSEKQIFEVKLSKKYCSPLKGFFVENNGHSIKVSFSEDDMSPDIYIEPTTAFPSRYIFRQLHLHWGQIKGQGSEHQVNNASYIMEMHIVHSKETKAAMELTESLDHDSHDDDSVTTKKPVEPNDDTALAVISIFFQVVPSPDNEALSSILRAAVAVNNSAAEHKSLDKEVLNLYSLFPKNKKVYQYKGSLTTPPCTEAVLWTLFPTQSKISQRQVEILKNLQTDHHAHLVGNYRDPQPMNGRKVQLRTLKFSDTCEKSIKKR